MMKKIEIFKKVPISKKKSIGILIKFPFWLKPVMKYVDFYVIPSLKPKVSREDEFLGKYLKLFCGNYPKTLVKIGGIV